VLLVSLVVQETPQIEVGQGLVKWAVAVSSIEQVPAAVAAAMHVALALRPGPVYLEIPVRARRASHRVASCTDSKTVRGIRLTCSWAAWTTPRPTSWRARSGSRSWRRAWRPRRCRLCRAASRSRRPCRSPSLPRSRPRST